MSDATRIEAVERFLRSGQCVCPFAQTAPLSFAVVSDTPRFERAALVRLARQFGKSIGATPNHAALIVSRSDGDYQSTRRWVRSTFLEFNVACGLVSSPNVAVERIERQIERKAPQVLDDTALMRLHILLLDEPVLTVCLAPCYPRSHPRWAPHPLLVATWMKDIGLAKIKAPGILDKIRERMAAEHGSLYDGDELMLPLPAVKQ